jgi:hypothetical protein
VAVTTAAALAGVPAPGFADVPTVTIKTVAGAASELGPSTGVFQLTRTGDLAHPLSGRAVDRRARVVLSLGGPVLAEHRPEPIERQHPPRVGGGQRVPDRGASDLPAPRLL